MDILAERLRRRPAKPMGSPRVGSNPRELYIILRYFGSSTKGNALEKARNLNATRVAALAPLAEPVGGFVRAAQRPALLGYRCNGKMLGGERAGSSTSFVVSSCAGVVH